MWATKEFTFDCAHMLSEHNGLCANLHGHTYKLQVSIGSIERISEGSSADMLMDFNDLKRIVHKLIIDKFDHAVIFSSKTFRGFAEEELLAVVKKHNLRYVIFERRTTAESMSQWMANILKDYFMEKYPNRSYEVEVKLWETPTSFATARSTYKVPKPAPKKK